MYDTKFNRNSPPPKKKGALSGSQRNLSEREGSQGLVQGAITIKVTLVSPHPTAKQHHVICGNHLFSGEWLEVHKCFIYCIRKIIEFYDNVTLPFTQLGIGGKVKIRAN